MKKGKTLIIFYNAWIFAQQLYICKQYNIKTFDIYVSTYYANNEEQKRRSEIWVHKKYPEINIVEDIGTCEEEYSIIVRPTPTLNSLKALHEKYPNAEYIYTEEGLSCYKPEFLHDRAKIEAESFYNSEYFLTKPLYNKSTEHIIKPTSLFDIIKMMFNQELVNLPKADNIVFTEPMEYDFNDLEYKHKVNEAIMYLPGTTIIKRHPRDDTSYTIKENTYECDRMLPGQALFYLYPNAKFFYTGESTLQLLQPEFIKSQNLIQNSK